MQNSVINSMFNKNLPGLSMALRTTIVFTTVRTLCFAGTPTSQSYSAGGSLGQCRSKHTLPKLSNVCVWKPPQRYCKPVWCHPQHGNIAESNFCKRCYMTEEELMKDSDCLVQDLKSIHEHDKAYVIDVRRPDELTETGYIPGAVNIPLDAFEESMKLNDDEFAKKFGAPKPDVEHDHIVINCRSGVRSLTALKIARSLGYLRCKHLPGGFLLWKEKYSDKVAQQDVNPNQCEK
eukprot:gene11041-12206_t